jgi:hypothetical protein
MRLSSGRYISSRARAPFPGAQRHPYGSLRNDPHSRIYDEACPTSHRHGTGTRSSQERREERPTNLPWTLPRCQNKFLPHIAGKQFQGKIAATPPPWSNGFNPPPPPRILETVGWTRRAGGAAPAGEQSYSQSSGATGSTYRRAATHAPQVPADIMLDMSSDRPTATAPCRHAVNSPQAPPLAAVSTRRTAFRAGRLLHSVSPRLILLKVVFFC